MRITLIGLGRPAADAEYRERILRIVAGDDIEDSSGVLDIPADRTHTGIDAHLDHALAADEFLRRRKAYRVVRLGRPAHR